MVGWVICPKFAICNTGMGCIAVGGGVSGDVCAEGGGTVW